MKRFIPFRILFFFWTFQGRGERSRQLRRVHYTSMGPWRTCLRAGIFRRKRKKNILFSPSVEGGTQWAACPLNADFLSYAFTACSSPRDLLAVIIRLISPVQSCISRSMDRGKRRKRCKILPPPRWILIPSWASIARWKQSACKQARTMQRSKTSTRPISLLFWKARRKVYVFEEKSTFVLQSGQKYFIRSGKASSNFQEACAMILANDEHT